MGGADYDGDRFFCWWAQDFSKMKVCVPLEYSEFKTSTKEDKLLKEIPVSVCERKTVCEYLLRWRSGCARNFIKQRPTFEFSGLFLPQDYKRENGPFFMILAPPTLR